jgi:S1-C subfamily serine protease
MDSVLAFAMRMLACTDGEHVRIGGVRGNRPFLVDLAVATHVEKRARITDFIDPTGGTLQALGIVAVGVTPAVAELLPSLRAESGVIVAAHSAAPAVADIELQIGDVIHTVNGEPVSTVEDLRGKLRQVPVGQPVVFQIERSGQLSFVTFDAE